MFGLKRRNQDIEENIAKVGPNRPVIEQNTTTTGINMSDDNTQAKAAPQVKSLGLRHPVGKGSLGYRYLIDALPEGVIIKRIFTRKSGSVNKWRVSYQGRTTEYFGHTLDTALFEFFRNQPDIAARYQENTNILER